MENIQDELADLALQEIATIWKVNQARSIRRDDGFDWWPGDFGDRQRLASKAGLLLRANDLRFHARKVLTAPSWSHRA